MITVSRETQQALDFYCSEVRKWQKKINLVSPQSLPDLEERHLKDSLQIAPLLLEASKPSLSLLDLGSGAGFPAIPLFLIARQQKAVIEQFELVESDTRKAAFLNNIRRTLELDIRVTPKRIENIEPRKASVVTARAFRPLAQLLELSYRHLAETAVLLLPKGQTWQLEVEQSRIEWSFEIKAHKSLTDPNAAVLAISKLKKC